MKRLAVLASGTGTNLEAIIEAHLPVTLVLTDRVCRALEIAKAHNLPHVLIDRRDFGYSPTKEWDRDGFTRGVVQALEEHRIDLVAMAGFMTIFSSVIFEKYENRILNTHPSLLPAFKGARAVPQALAAGVSETGCSVHIASRELDSGHVLAQAKVPILSGDTESTLHERIKTVERKLYPKTISAYLSKLRA